MKSFYLIILILLNIFLCQENITNTINETEINTSNDNSTNTTNTIEVSKIEEKKESGNSFKTLEISFKLIDYLNTLKNNLTIVEKAQLRNIFQHILDIILDDPEQKLNSSQSEMLDKFTEDVFESLANKEKNAIIMEEIYEQYNISKVMEYITRFLKSLNLETILGPFISMIVKFLGEMFLDYFKNTDL